MDSWSKKYYCTLTEAQHQANDAWFSKMLDMLTPTGTLIIPGLGIVFNKQGEEITGAAYGPDGHQEVRPRHLWL